VIKRQNVAAVILLLSVAIAAYFPATTGAPLWDDDGHLTKPELRSWKGLGRIWTDVRATQQYYPLLHTAFWVEHRLWGDNPLGYHLTNIVQHVMAATLLAMLWARLGLTGGWFAAALFSLHPVAVESVAWITEQKNTLSLVLYLAAALTYVRFHESRRLLLYIAATLLFAGALLSKSVTATLPAALLVILWWRRGELSWRREVGPLIPWFALSGAMAAVTIWVERTFIGAAGEEWSLTFVQRVLLAGRAVWFYFGKLLWPSDLTFIYPRWDLDPRAVWSYAYPIAAVAVIAALWLVRKRTRTPLAIALLFLGSLVPALGFVNVYPFRYSFVADHFQYLAATYVIAGIATGLTLLARSWPRYLAIGGAACLLVALAMLTWRQSAMYRDEETLYRVTLERNPTCWLCYNNLGLGLLEEGKLSEALALFERGLRVSGDTPQIQFSMAAALERTGRPADAIALYRRGLRTGANNPAAHNNLGNLLRRHGKQDEALEHFQRAIQLDPNHFEAHNNIGTVMADRGRWEDAVRSFEAALAIRPDFAEARTNLAIAENGHGLALATAGRVDEAQMRFEAALRIRPNYGRAHFNLGNLLHGLGRIDQAISHYEQARSLEPQSADVWHRLAVARFQQGRPDEATAHFERAIELDPASADLRYDAAVALLRSGQRSRAMAHLEAAVSANPEHPQVQALLRALQR
jgi:tetratricopeptide (TPR) repeat protein